MSATLLTAEQFAERKLDLPEGGRWSELVAGEIVSREPPDDLHGNVVLNLSKALAQYAQKQPPGRAGYACYEIGVVVARRPDTVRCPAMSWFTGGEPFAEADKIVADEVPALAVEIASSRRRRTDAAPRTAAYLKRGVQVVWTVDPADRQVLVSQIGRPTDRLLEHQLLRGEPILPGFSLMVGDLFAVPRWWKG